MKFNIMLTGVGGEGVLTTQVMIARAANIEGHYVRGVQLHGLAQRGGTIPAFVRFGSEKEISSPGEIEKNIKAFDLGLELGKQKRFHNERPGEDIKMA
jgi:indolepyruvate ferredoxin oxidoreductase beta subunit